MHKLSGLVDMVVTWVKTLTNGAFILQKEASIIKILFRIPQVRVGLLVKVFNWFAFGIDELRKHEQENQMNEQKGISAKKNKSFALERGNGFPGKFEILNFVLHCLRCFKQFVLDSNKLDNIGSLDLLKIPNQDKLIKGLVQYFSLQDKVNFVDLNIPLMDQIMTHLLTFYSIVKDKLHLIAQEQESKDDPWMEDIISSLSTIFKQLALANKNLSEDSNQDVHPQGKPQIVINTSMIHQLGKLLLTKEFKMKEIQRDIKSIFNDITTLSNSNNLGQNSIEEFFKNGLEQALRKFILII